MQLMELSQAERALMNAKGELNATLSKLHRLEARLGYRRREKPPSQIKQPTPPFSRPFPLQAVKAPLPDKASHPSLFLQVGTPPDKPQLPSPLSLQAVTYCHSPPSLPFSCRKQRTATAHPPSPCPAGGYGLPNIARLCGRECWQSSGRSGEIGSPFRQALPVPGEKYSPPR